MRPSAAATSPGKELIPAAQMVGKVRAAADVRRESMVIIARTDACAVEGFEAAIDRAQRYIEAGADMTFVEASESLDDLKAVPKRLAAPQLLNMVLGGKTPIIDAAEATRLGFAFVLYANAALQGAILGMENALKVLRDKGVLEEGAVASFAERQRLVDKASFDAMEIRYAAGASTG
jgi:2-methylisocitrate lyase-like PEP mutase family enzyme